MTKEETILDFFVGMVTCIPASRTVGASSWSVTIIHGLPPEAKEPGMYSVGGSAVEAGVLNKLLGVLLTAT